VYCEYNKLCQMGLFMVVVSTVTRWSCIDYQYILLCYWLNKLLYYCKTQQDGSYQKTLICAWRDKCVFLVFMCASSKLCPIFGVLKGCCTGATCNVNRREGLTLLGHSAVSLGLWFTVFWRHTRNCEACLESKDAKASNMYNIFNLQKRQCEWIAFT
jgi:hypothetical protein